MTEALRITKIKAPRGARVFEIVWSDGLTVKIPHLVLRGYCPCAACQGHSGEIRFVQGGDQELESVRTVGNYALELTWGDRHASGVYSFRYLRLLSEKVAADALSEHPPLPR